MYHRALPCLFRNALAGVHRCSGFFCVHRPIPERERTQNERHKEKTSLTRTSAFREDRKNYLTEDGYTYWRWDEDLKKEVPVHIGLGEEYTDLDGKVRTIDHEILILLDSIDHAEDVEQDEYERHTDKVFSDRLARYERSDKSGEDVANPWDEIEDTKSDPFTLRFLEDAPMDEKVQKILEFMEGLTEAQRDLVYDHLGAWKYLEDVRREEEARTGKAVTQQAISNRWNKIIAKGCKHFGVEKPRKRKK